MKHFINNEGKYIGAFVGCEPECECIEVPTAPTDARQKFVDEAWQELPVSETYRENRAAEYPPIGDQLDAIMKWLATESEFNIPADLKSVAMQCMAVKSKYPKS